MIGFETASEELEIHHILFQTILQKSALVYCNWLFNYVLLNSYCSSSDINAVNNELDRIYEVALCDQICENFYGGGLRKIIRTSVKRAGLPAQIWTCDLSNMKHEC